MKSAIQINLNWIKARLLRVLCIEGVFTSHPHSVSLLREALTQTNPFVKGGGVLHVFTGVTEGSKQWGSIILKYENCCESRSEKTKTKIKCTHFWSSLEVFIIRVLTALPLYSLSYTIPASISWSRIITRTSPWLLTVRAATPGRPTAPDSFNHS